MPRIIHWFGHYERVMPIHFDPSIIESFFGIQFEQTIPPEPDCLLYWIDYAGPVLRYAVILDVERDTAMVSGDIRNPFCGESMYEFGVPCTAIVAHPAGRGQDGIALGFFYGDTADEHNRTLTIMKRSDGDLVVWPSWPYPKGHPNSYDVIENEQ